MINESIYVALVAGIQEAFADLESHMEDPDNSRHSSQGILELTRDRLATLAAMPYMPGAIPPAAMTSAPAPLESTDQWGRPRCQQIENYVDTGAPYQCALVEDHAGECDPLPIYPDAEPAAEPFNPDPDLYTPSPAETD